MDWTGCKYVEQVAGRLALVRDSHIEANRVLELFEDDADSYDIAEALGLSQQAVDSILCFAFVQDWHDTDLSSLSNVSAPEINWTGCGFVECVPGRMGGIPVVRHSRVAAETIVLGMLLGETPHELAYNFTLKLSEVKGVIAFATRRLPLSKAG